MILGVDYYPEHWPVHMLEEDLDRIVKLGANTIRIGEFAWHLMETVEGHFDFSYFDQVISKAKSRGLNVIFGTPTATFPAWVAKNYPEVVAMNQSGIRHAFGGRRIYCYNAPEYKRLTRNIVTALLAHYKDEAGIIAWQIDNELGHEGSDQCYCPVCHREFQAYLKSKYGQIGELNQRYGTIFWGQTYNDFDEIPLPTETITTHNPALLLDWARFRSESINRYATLQIDIVNHYKQPHQKVIHNLFGGFFDRAYDQNVLAEQLDVVAYDNYPVWGGLEKPLSPSHIALTLDYIRGLKRENFWIVEELMGAQGHTVIGYLPRPNQAKLWSHQAMARGCEALLYFRWRGMTRGAEQFCQGILDADNLENDKYREVESFFKEVAAEESLYMTPIKAEVALLYDYDNRWSWAAQPQSHAFDYTGEFVRLHAGFHRLNVMTDVIDQKKDFSHYKIVVLPVMQIVDEPLLDRLQAFVAAGGTVVFGFRSGIKNRDNNIRLSENILNDFCGLKVVSYESLGIGQQIGIKGVGGDEATARVWRDLIRPLTAETLYAYTDAFFDQYAAITVNTGGTGKVYYVGAGIDENLAVMLARKWCEEKHIAQIASPEGVEVVHRAGRKIICNHNGHQVAYEGYTVEPYETVII